MKTQIKSLFEGQELSTEFQEKVLAIIESHVEEQIADKEKELKESLEAQNKETLEAKLTELELQTEQYIEDEVLPNIDKYITEGVKQFVKENKSSVADSLKVKLAESLLTGFGNLVVEHNVVIPEGSLDIVEQAKQDLETTQAKLDEEIEQRLNAEKLVESLKREKVITSVSEGLTDTQVEKLGKAANKLTFVGESEFAESVKDLRDSLFPVNEDKPEVETTKEQLDEALEDEEEVESDSYLTSFMKSYK